MIKIYNKNLECVGILNFQGEMQKITPYFDDVYYQNLNTGAETLEFSTFGDSSQAKYLKVGNYLAMQDDDDVTKLFQIISVDEVHDDNYIKTVYAETAGMELINEIVRPMEVNGKNVTTFLQSILADSEWKVGKVDSDLWQPMDFKITDYKSIYSCLQEYVIGLYGAEISFRVKFENNELVGKYIDLYSERNGNYEHLFYYSQNMSEITRKVDSSSLVTALIGVGNNGVTFKEVSASDKPKNQDFIASSSALAKWGNNGQHIMGVHQADTDDPATLLDLTREELKKRIEPRVTYEVGTELLGKKVRLGATVGVVDHDLDIYLNARVSELRTSKTNKDSNECVISNFVEVKSKISSFNTSNILAQIKDYLNSLELGILTQTAIDNIKAYLTALGLTKAEIDAIFETLKLPEKIEIDDGKDNGNYDDNEVTNDEKPNEKPSVGGNDYLTTLAGDKQDFVMKDGKTYKCGTLKSLKFSLPSTPSKTYSSQITFRTTKNTTPTIFDQSDIVWLTGEHCIRGALLPRADTTYTITIKYNSNSTIPRKYRGTVKHTSHGGSYKAHSKFSGSSKVLELAKSYYDVRSKFKYKTTTPLTKFSSGTPASNKSKWYTGGKYHIDCSTYINQIFRGRGYKNSIYYNSDKYGIGTSNTYSWATNLGRYASEIAKTCVKNGWHLTDIKSQKDWTKLKSGDLVFWSSRSNNTDRNETVKGRYMQVGHVAVIRTVKSDGYVTTFEVSTPNGTILNRSLAKNFPEKILFFARIRK